MIYLASPYSHPNMEVKIARFEAAAKAAAVLMNQGHIIFAPIAMTHPMAIYGELPGNWEFWEKFDNEFLNACESLIVLMLEGWSISSGVTAEIKIMEGLGKVVKYMSPTQLGVENVWRNDYLGIVK